MEELTYALPASAAEVVIEQLKHQHESAGLLLDTEFRPAALILLSHSLWALQIVRDVKARVPLAAVL